MPMAKKKEELKQINLPQARQILKYLDNIWYIDLTTHKELDDLVMKIIESEDYKKAKADVEVKAQELLADYNKVEKEVREEISKIEAKFEWAWKRESKKLRQEIGELEQKIKDEFAKAKDSLKVYQDMKMDIEARNITIAEVSPVLYEVLERKFYIADFEWEAKPIEVVDTDKLVTNVL